MLMVSVPLGARVSVRSTGGPETFQVPFTTPVESVISTQLPLKYAGISVEQPVTSVAPVLPAWATPDPREGSCVGWLLRPPLSIVRLPYSDDGPCSQIDPAPPIVGPLVARPAPATALRLFSSVPVALEY